MDKAFSFTKSDIEALPQPTPGKRETYRDTHPRAGGLLLRITSTGTKTFCLFRRTKGGQPERVTLGQYPDMGIEQARKAAALVSAKFAEGANPAEVKRAHKAELTFADVLKEFLEHKRNRSGKPLAPKTKVDYEAAARLYLGKIAKVRLSAIDRDKVAQIHRHVGKEHPTAANRVKALVSSVFTYAADRGYFSGANPAVGIRGFAENKRERFLQASELPRFFEAILAEPNDIMRDYLLLSLLAGARAGNVKAMRWDELNLEEAVWRIPTTKNGEPQSVTLAPEAVAILAERRQKSVAGEQFVFPGVGKTGHMVEPKKAWTRVMERAGIPAGRKVEGGVVMHDLRRTLGSWQAKTGASLVIIGKSLNHKTVQATQIYARLDLDPVRQSVNTATAAMLEAGGLRESAEVVAFTTKRSTGN